VPLDHLVDQSVSGDLSGILFSGGPDGARLILSTIAAAMMTFTGLVFSVTMLVLQLASSQLSPRVTRTFLRDRINQAVLGLFVATFLYSLLVLREICSPTSGPAFVPAIAVSVAYGLLLASVGFFVLYIHHMAQAMRAATVIRSVADETRADPEHGSAARQHVERCDHLHQQPGRPISNSGGQRQQPDTIRVRGDESQWRVRLDPAFGRTAHEWVPPHVVGYVDGLEAGFLGGLDHVREG
jgi:uncharacterized membrane protein